MGAADFALAFSRVSRRVAIRLGTDTPGSQVVFGIVPVGLRSREFPMANQQTRTLPPELREHCVILVEERMCSFALKHIHRKPARSQLKNRYTSSVHPAISRHTLQPQTRDC